ncbi:MAG: uncharacterized membrane protein YqaE (UPF0057 family) [Flavobacteriales bacterium]|jgi:uncharacterized membrane protein YqaE (UPF0057 family)
MKELLRLKSFQQILLCLFALGFVVGVLYGIYIFSDKLRYYSIIPFLPVVYFISRGLFKNSKLFFADFKSLRISA